MGFASADHHRSRWFPLEDTIEIPFLVPRRRTLPCVHRSPPPLARGSSLSSSAAPMTRWRTEPSS
ncbi:unnamed protein product [Musa banksii]